jgi:hypothetical protein
MRRRLGLHYSLSERLRMPHKNCFSALLTDVVACQFRAVSSNFTHMMDDLMVGPETKLGTYRHVERKAAESELTEAWVSRAKPKDKP